MSSETASATALCTKDSISRESQFEFVRILGHGGMAQVELWRQREYNRDLVVAKRVYLEGMSESEEEDAKLEAKSLKRMKHPNIVKYQQSWLNRGEGVFIIVQEYCPGGDLSQQIREVKKMGRFFSPARVQRWLAQLTHALLYCHTVWRILHRDLKPGNIFLAEGHEDVRLGDFGIAKAMNSTRSLCHTFIGTMVYMSPEVVRMKPYGMKSDVWSLGFIIFEVCTLVRPFQGKDAVTTIQKLVEPDGPPTFAAANEGAAAGGGDAAIALEAVCTAMLTKDVEARPSLNELLLNTDLCLRELVENYEAEIRWEETLLPALGDKAKSLDTDSDKLSSSMRRSAVESREPSPEAPPPPDPTQLSPHKANSARAGEAATISDTRPVSPAGVRPPARPKMPATAGVRPPPPPPDAPPRWAGQTATKFPTIGGAARASTDATAKGVSLEDAVQRAAEVRTFYELTSRREELEALLTRLQQSDLPESDRCGSDEVLLPGAVEPTPAVAVESDAAGAGDAAGALCAAEMIDARLSCLGIISAEGQPDPVELTATLSRVRELGLESEDSGQALVVHAHRLCMQAVDTIARSGAALEEVEKATELLEAVQSSEAEAAGATASSSHHRKSIELAQEKLQTVRAQQRLIGLRCLCGTFVRLLSVKHDAPFSEVLTLIAKRWRRPPGSLNISWRNGAMVMAIANEDQWRRCVQQSTSAGVAPIELVLQPLKGQAAMVRRPGNKLFRAIP